MATLAKVLGDLMLIEGCFSLGMVVRDIVGFLSAGHDWKRRGCLSLRRVCR